ncbi:uncharacterized protein LOC111623832 [Centruroides sculpturatus]|uniref:uncharacterized protein LOC111623832 n=1 Tax=Centruroides sculpturatus TaxID=218467 RepID=UPI000C6C9742|nr:uncharacterized protein LOC111623832 [Centruroides sculpturatus]
MTLVMLYVLPMLLGRTYDMKNDKVGVDIFPASVITNPEKIERYFTDSEYRIITDSKEARDFLDASGNLALKIKTGKIDIEGAGSYLKDAASRSNSVEILVKTHFETETHTISSSAKPVENWYDLDKEGVGTHYARSITYGGDLIASLRFVAKNSADRELIKATIQGSLQSDSGSFGLQLKGKFNQIQQNVKDSASLEIHYYATVPIKGVPNDMASLMSLVDSFADQTKEVNGGLGVPLRMELFPLSALNKTYPTYIQTSALNDQMDLLEELFDDITSAKATLREWMRVTPPVLPLNYYQKIGEYSASLEAISATFYDVISKLDLSNPENDAQFTPAFAIYDNGTGILPDKYTKKFEKLKMDMMKNVEALQTEGGGATYVHWGSTTCNGASEESVYKGWAAGAKDGGTEILCMPEEENYNKEVAIEKQHYHLKLLQIVYSSRQSVYRDYINKNIPCALCRVKKHRSSVRMIPGTSLCKYGNVGDFRYSGYLMSTDAKTRKKEFICVEGSDPEVRSSAGETIAFTDVLLKCNTLPCSAEKEGNGIPCAVCAF